MNKRFLPYIVLLAAVLLFWFVKTNQRHVFPKHEDDHISVTVNNDEVFDRHTKNIIYSKHALCRMDCRHIDKSEVMEILENGKINYNKIEEDERGKTYPLEGVTHDRQHVRIVVAPKQDELVIVTVIDLEKDWYCDCK